MTNNMMTIAIENNDKKKFTQMRDIFSFYYKIKKKHLI